MLLQKYFEPIVDQSSIHSFLNAVALSIKKPCLCINLLIDEWMMHLVGGACAILAFQKGIVRQEFPIDSFFTLQFSEIVWTVCQIKHGDSFKLIRNLTLRWNLFWSSIFIKSSRERENRFWKWERKQFPMWSICWILLVSWLIDGFLDSLIGWFLLVNCLIFTLGYCVIFILDLLKYDD